MSVDRLIYALTDIKEEFIAEYIQYQAKKQHTTVIKRIVAVAACVALIACSFYLGRSESEDIKGGDWHNFSSYEEFCEMLPDGHLMEYLPNENNINISCSGCINYNATDYARYEEYWYLSVDVEYDNLGGVNVFHTRDYWKTTNEVANVARAGFPQENSFTKVIAGIEVLFMYREGVDGKFDWLAEFSNGDDLYQVTTYALDNQLLLAFLTEWLELAD